MELHRCGSISPGDVDMSMHFRELRFARLSRSRSDIKDVRICSVSGDETEDGPSLYRDIATATAPRYGGGICAFFPLRLRFLSIAITSARSSRTLGTGPLRSMT